MKKFFSYAAGIVPMLMAPMMFVSAQNGIVQNAGGGGFGDLLLTIIDVINTTLIPFILAIAFLAFVWGVFTFFIAGGANEEKRESGKNLMIYAVAGFVLIIIFWGVVNLIADSIGLSNQGINNVPNTGF